LRRDLLGNAIEAVALLVDAPVEQITLNQDDVMIAAHSRIYRVTPAAA
jgi:hypothetical protein